MNKQPDIYRLTSLGRPIDPRHRSNLIAVVGSLLVAIVFLMYSTSSTPLESTWLEAGVGVFLAWAIARELDPDHTSSATIAMIASCGIALIAAPSLLTGAGILIAARLITGTVGSDLKALDPVVLVVLGAMLGSGPTSLAVVPALVAGVIIIGNRSIRSVGTAVTIGLAATVALLANQPLLGWSDPTGWSIVFLIGAVVALAASIPARAPTTLTDVGRKDLFRWRISVSRIALAATIGVAFAIGGGEGLDDIYATGGAALLGVATVQTLWRIRRRQAR